MMFWNLCQIKLLEIRGIIMDKKRVKLAKQQFDLVVHNHEDEQV